MAEIIRKNLTCFRDPKATNRFDSDQIQVISTERTYAAAQLAASTLLADLAEFQPPITDVTADDIKLEFSFDANRMCETTVAVYSRSDPPTTGLADGYTSDGFPMPVVA
ncbi:MAG TPA: hypothetical protein PJ984_03830 [Candidatus Saccharibacteria bacterium]|mgnify:FL=1|jgi:hypothetical protein|nr:hypothetical protein [Candidatus Saccharibacteria bacterium]